MPKSPSRFAIVGIAVSAIWLAVFAGIAYQDWNHREAERDYLYQHCVELTPNVAECKSLGGFTRREALRDDLIDFSVLGLAPVALFWLTVWGAGQWRALRPKSDASGQS